MNAKYSCSPLPMIGIAFVALVILTISNLESPLLIVFSLVGELACIAAFLLINTTSKNQRSAFNEKQLANGQLSYASTDNEGKIVNCSQGLLATTGLDPQSLIGHTFKDLASIQHQEHFLTPNAIPTAFQLQACPMQWFELKPHTHNDTELLLLNDVSDRKRAEALELKEPITGMGNKRAYEENVPALLAKAQRTESYLTLAIINLDFFDDFNNSYGHEEGNNALKVIASAIKTQLRRPTDHCYRLNSDEFVIVFEHDAPNVCQRALEKVLQTIEDQQLPQQNSTVSAFITASIGAFGAKGNQITDAENLYMTADLQLFKAKQTRNHVHCFFPEQTATLNAQPLAQDSIPS